MLLFALWFYLATANASCKRKTELRNILEHPKTLSEKYLKTISDKLCEYSGALFTSQADSIVSSFEQEYGVEIALQFSFLVCVPQFCFSVSKTVDVDDFAFRSFPFTISQSGPIESISIGSLIGSINMNKKSMEYDHSFWGILLQPPSSSPGVVEIPTCDVVLTSFNLGF